MGTRVMIKLLTGKISSLFFADQSPFVFFLLQRNRFLHEKNKTLNKTVKEHIQTIKILKKELAIVKNTKATDLTGNIKRMQDGEL
jgi:hypothetical protein